MLRKTKIKARIAMVLVILALIATIVNFFIKVQTINLVIYVVVVISLGLDMMSFIEDAFKAANEAIDERFKKEHTIAAVRELRFQVDRRSDSTLFTKKEMLNLIDEAIEDAEQWEESK